MEHITAKETAEKWNVSLRTVQQLCVDGRIEGAVKIGSQWMIPEYASKPGRQKRASLSSEDKNAKEAGFSVSMPLLNTQFNPGTARETAENVKDKHQRNMALAEYYYFSGRAEKAVALTEKYLRCDDLGLRLPAIWIYSYASLSIDNIGGARLAMGAVRETISSLTEDTPQEIRALVMFIATASSVLLHLPLEYEMPPMGEFIATLPQGMRLFALYIYAHYAYLNKEYAASTGIAETALALETKIYPIPTIYLHLIAVMDYVNLKKPEYAQKHMLAAWEIAKNDGFIEPFAEHHGLVCGMIEATVKKGWPKEFKKIIDVTYRFSSGWRCIHNMDTGNMVADTLSTTEFVVAMLATKDYSNKEISAFLGISENTVKAHIGHAMSEFGLSDRRELARYMLM